MRTYLFVHRRATTGIGIALLVFLIGVVLFMTGVLPPKGGTSVVDNSNKSGQVNSGGTSSGSSITTGTSDTKVDNSIDPNCNVKDHELEVGEIYFLSNGCHVKGDVEVSLSKDGPWIPKFDNIGSTGLIVVANNPNGTGIYVHAPWGANASPRTVKSLQAEMTKSGCESGCKTIDLVYWPSKDAPTAEKTTVAANNGDCSIKDTEMKSGEKMLVPAGCNIKGDVEFAESQNGVYAKAYKVGHGASDGTLVHLTKDTWIYAQWGANVSPRTVEDLKAEMLKNGCEANSEANKGCEVVNLVIH